MLSSLNKVIYVTGDNIDEFFDINKNKDIVLIKKKLSKEEQEQEDEFRALLDDVIG